MKWKLLIFVLLFSSCTPHQNLVLEKEKKAKEDFKIAQEFLQKGKEEKALKIFQRILKLYPYVSITDEATLSRAKLLKKRGRLLESLSGFQDYIEKYPRLLYEEIRNEQTQIVKQILSRQEKRILNHPTKDSSSFLKVLERIVESSPYSAEASNFLLTIGKTRLRRNEKEEALAIYEKIIEDYPNSPSSIEASYEIIQIYFSEFSKEDERNRKSQNFQYLRETRKSCAEFLLKNPKHPLAEKVKKIQEKAEELEQKHLDKISKFYKNKKNEKK